MDNVKIVNLIDRCVDILTLSDEDKANLRRFYFEMPKDVRTDIAIHFREIFPEVTPQMFLHMNTAEVEIIVKMASDLVKIFNKELQLVRFFFSPTWIKQLEDTIFIPAAYSTDFVAGINRITNLYFEALATAKNNKHALQFMVNFLEAWLIQKESGWRFYMKIFHTDEYARATASAMSLGAVMMEYLQTNIEDDITRMRLEKLFYAIIANHWKPSEPDNLFTILDVFRAANIIPNKSYREVLIYESADVSYITDSEIADNVGQVSIFGNHNFGSMSIDTIKEELIRLNRGTIAEYLGRKNQDSGISFDISDQVKMIIREELSPNLCAVTIKRGNEVDMATLLTHESKVYLLFRKIGVDNATFGISLGSIGRGERELIGISNESEFTYSLVGGEEIGIAD